jgi:aminoglycoside N3'-acetyltransferase
MKTVAQLVEDLHRLGVRPGDTLMVHASLRKLGPVEGGHPGVVRAIDSALGPAGTWMMVLGARDDRAWVNERPEEERSALLAGAEPFDPERTPAQDDVGWLAEVFRREPGTLVSNHPEGRFGARGDRAEVLLQDPPWDDYYGDGSALDRFARLGGRVLRIGADHDTVTLLHLAEFRARLPSKRRVRRYRVVLGARDPEIRVVDTFDDSDGIVEWSGPDYFGVILREYLATGRARAGLVGNAPSELLDGSDLLTFGIAWLERTFG